MHLPRHLSPFLYVRLLVAATVLTIARTAPAEQPVWLPPQATPGTLGSALEDFFRQVRSDCGIARLTSPKGFLGFSGGSPLSDIPKDLQQTALLQRAVTLVPGNNANNLFLYVDNGATLALARIQNPDPGILLPASFIPLNTLPIPRTLKDNVLYTQSCSTFLRAGANLGITFGVGSVKSALNSEYDSNTQVGFVQGVFDSPFHQYLQGNAGAPSQLTAYLTLWHFYHSFATDHPTATLPDSYYKSFTGATAFRFTGRKRATKYTLDAAAGGGFGIVTADGHLNMAVGDSSSLTVQGFETYVDNDKGGNPMITPAVLPTPDAIVKYLADLRPTVEPQSPVLVQGTSFSQRIAIQGIPSSLCAGHWKVDAKSVLPSTPLGTVALNNVGMVSDACVFSVAYLTNGDVKGVTELSYELELDERIGPAAARMRVSLLPRLNFEPTFDVSPSEIQPGFERSQTGKTFAKWDLPVKIVAGNNPVQAGETPAVGNLRLACGLVSPPVSVSAGPISKDSLQLIVREDLGGEDLGKIGESCTLEAKLTVRLATGVSVERNLTGVQINRRTSPPKTSVVLSPAQ